MLSLRIAWRYLFAPKSHNAVNIISTVTLCGVAVATMAMVAVLSVFNGFTDLAESRFSSLDPPLLAIADKGKVIQNADSLAHLLESLPEIDAALPVVEDQGLAIYGNKQMAVTLVGVPRQWAGSLPIESVVIDGTDMTTTPAAGMATLSVGTAARLGARPDLYRTLQVYVPKRRGRYNPANPMAAFRADTLRVSAVYRTDQSELDEDRLIMPLERLRDLLDYDSGQASSIMIIPSAGTSDAKARMAAAEITRLPLLSRQEQHGDAFRMIRIEKWISFLMLTFILLIASFNIISTLSLLIIEKEESIAILYSMGATRNTVNRIFVVQGWLISIFGGIAGITLGSALVLAQQWGGFIRLGGDPAQMSISVYPVRLDPADLLQTIAVVALAGLLTGLVTLAVRKTR